MKFASYFSAGARVGAIFDDDGRLWDLRAVMTLWLFRMERITGAGAVAEALVPSDMALFIRLSHGRLEMFREALAWAGESEAECAAMLPAGVRLNMPIAEAFLLPPVPQPSKVICVGNSYVDYLVDQKLPREEWPKDVKISFLKSPTALIGHGETIGFPPDTEEWDYENELTIVVGRTCRDIAIEEADRYIFGYTILNDACVRDIPRWAGRYDSPRGKACDSFAPCGPFVVPHADLGQDPNDLEIRTWIDEELRQDVRTSGLLWPVQRILAYVSRYITLAPGDVISTGSGCGNALTGPGDWMRSGQTVRCEIEGIGTLSNPVAYRRWGPGAKSLPPLNGIAS